MFSILTGLYQHIRQCNRSGIYILGVNKQTNKQNTAKFGFEAFMEASVISPLRYNILEDAIGNSEVATHFLRLSKEKLYLRRAIRWMMDSCRTEEYRVQMSVLQSLFLWD